MTITPVPFDAGLDAYDKQAADLVEAGEAGNVSDAQTVVARSYDYQSWAHLAEHVTAIAHRGSPTFLFESAAEAVVAGNVDALASLLHDHPGLIRSRSTRVTHFDPPVHRATLLHYVAANGVEGYRQRTPKNAVAIAKMLLEAGAEVDALADLYGGQCTTMSLLVSSCHPAEAGLQVLLVDTLVDFGAAVDERGSGEWTSPLFTALAFGYRDAAEALVRRGARVKTLAAAAGLGRLEDTQQLLPNASAEDRHRALALAAQHGHVEIVRLLLDKGEDPIDTTQKEIMATPHRCIKRCGRAMKMWCGCSSSGERVSTSKTRSTRAPRSAGRRTPDARRLPTTCAASPRERR